MTYNVFSGTLNPTQSQSQQLLHLDAVYVAFFTYLLKRVGAGVKLWRSGKK